MQQRSGTSSPFIGHAGAASSALLRRASKKNVLPGGFAQGASSPYLMINQNASFDRSNSIEEDIKNLGKDGEAEKTRIQQLFRQDSDSIIDGEEVKRQRKREQKMQLATQHIGGSVK